MSQTIHRIETVLPEDARGFLRLLNGTQSSKCLLCGQTQRYMSYDHYGRVTCSNHKAPICSFCGHFITADPVTVTGYGVMHRACSGLATQREMDAIVKRLKEAFNDQHFLLPAFTYSILTAEQMAERHCTDNNGNTISPLGLTYNKRPEQNKGYLIEIMGQQPKTGLIKTMAHEMGHLWLFENNIPYPGNEYFSEGFCNLLAALMLKYFNEEDAALYYLAAMINDPSRNYGVAFRQLKIVYDVKGMTAVVAAMRNTKKAVR